MTVIYLISALGGLTPMFLGLKSSRLIMSTFDLKVKILQLLLFIQLLLLPFLFMS